MVGGGLEWMTGGDGERQLQIQKGACVNVGGDGLQMLEGVECQGDFQVNAL